MLSLETAKRLKDAGLKWEPKEGDWYNDGFFPMFPQRKDIWMEEYSRDYSDSLTLQTTVEENGTAIFIPRLDQLLAEIEKRGYGWKLEKFHAYNLRRMEIYKVNDLLGCFEGNSPEEAAAEALLRVLEQEARNGF